MFARFSFRTNGNAKTRSHQKNRKFSEEKKNEVVESNTTKQEKKQNQEETSSATASTVDVKQISINLQY
jgi:hypothetical protein